MSALKIPRLTVVRLFTSFGFEGAKKWTVKKCTDQIARLQRYTHKDAREAKEVREATPKDFHPILDSILRATGKRPIIVMDKVSRFDRQLHALNTQLDKACKPSTH